MITTRYNLLGARHGYVFCMLSNNSYKKRTGKESDKSQSCFKIQLSRIVIFTRTKVCREYTEYLRS